METVSCYGKFCFLWGTGHINYYKFIHELTVYTLGCVVFTGYVSLFTGYVWLFRANLFGQFCWCVSVSDEDVQYSRRLMMCLTCTIWPGWWDEGQILRRSYSHHTRITHRSHSPLPVILCSTYMDVPIRAWCITEIKQYCSYVLLLACKRTDCSTSNCWQAVRCKCAGTCGGVFFD